MSRPISGVPTLAVDRDRRTTPAEGETARSRFRYQADGHEELPHVVKFSGGRSSALLLFILLESGLLKADRGDVVVFNNTSAEHPETYRFSAECKRRVEDGYGIPFFWIEFQTYEDARNGEWTRLPSYRIVEPAPFSDARPSGHHRRGEVFEELMSWDGFVPNVFQRTCTRKLKLETTRAFLKDWFANRPDTERLGHFGDRSRIDDDDLYQRHRRCGGDVPREIFLRKKAFVRARPLLRPAQRFRDFSPVARSFASPYLNDRNLGSTVSFGRRGVEYAAFVGLRHDEPRRIRRVSRRNAGGPAAAGYEGEHVYMPLHDMEIGARDVETFWRRRRWDLKLAPDSGLSNCTYCFLKGVGTLGNVARTLAPGTGSALRGTPSDVAWWIEMEQRYGRNLKDEGRTVKGDVPDQFIGFFGTKITYRKLADAGWDRTSCAGAPALRPCDCTD